MTQGGLKNQRRALFLCTLKSKRRSGIQKAGRKSQRLFSMSSGLQSERARALKGQPEKRDGQRQNRRQQKRFLQHRKKGGQRERENSMMRLEDERYG